MKFTEEQYQKIVEVQEKEFWASILAGSIKKNFWSALDSELTDFINENRLYDETAAVANPLTREWAHDKFVEKEAKYYWKLKNNWEFALVSTRALVTLSLHNKSKLTESKIREWGYNPEMFDREEVQ